MFPFVSVSLTPEAPGWTRSSGCSHAERLCRSLKLLPVALLTQHRIQPGSAASRAHRSLALPLSTTYLGVPCLPGPFPTGLLLVLAGPWAPSPAPFPGISLSPTKFPSNQVSSLPRSLRRAALPSSSPLEKQAPGLALTYMFFPRTPHPTWHRFPGALCPAQVSAECVWCYWPKGQCLSGCHRLPVTVQSLELGGPGSPPARCSHSPCLYCQHLPAGILGELVLQTSPKPASGHLAPLGCADRSLTADRLHSGLLDVVLSL